MCSSMRADELASAPHIRPVRAEDKPAVLAFCQHSFEWGDYIEHVFDDWLSREGDFLAAELDGRVVGIVRIAYLGHGDQAWFEGMRVDPACRGRGVARALARAEVAAARRRGCRVGRSMVADHNVGGHAVSRFIGLQPILRHAHLLWRPGGRGDGEGSGGGGNGEGSEGGSGTAPRVVAVRNDAGDVARAWDLVQRASCNRSPDGTPGVLHGWVWEEATPDSLTMLANRGELVTTQTWDALAALNVQYQEADAFVSAGDAASAARFGVAAANLAAERGWTDLVVVAPDEAAYLNALQAIGYDSRRVPGGRIGVYVIYEMNLEQGTG